jgi:hypothetical protein
VEAFVMDLNELRAEYEANRGTSNETTAGATKWEAVVAALRKHFHQPDLQAARALYAAVAAHGLKGQPVWPMAVAPPGSMKTELLKGLDGLPNVHSIDAVTSKTFISGQIREEGKGDPARPSSLLQRIGPKGIVLCLDFSTILALKSDDRQAVMADMRRIYDGELKKEFGTSDEVPRWKGRITFAVAVTDEIDRHYGVIQSLGARFVMIRMGRGNHEAAMRAMLQDPAEVTSDIQRAVHSLFTGLGTESPELSKGMLTRLAALADFAAMARSYVPRDGRTKQLESDPQAESATRLSQQLAQLAKGSAILDGRNAVSETDYGVAIRVAFDSIPANRRSVLNHFLRGDRLAMKAATKSYAIDDLEALGLLEDSALTSDAKMLVDRFDPDERFTTSPPNAITEIHDSDSVSAELVDASGAGGTTSEVEAILDSSNG